MAATAPKRDLKVDAQLMAHLLTHKPANPHCDSCLRGKMRQPPHPRGGFNREVVSWGDIITADHMVQPDKDWSLGLGGMRYVLSVKDIATGLKMAYPMPCDVQGLAQPYVAPEIRK